MWQDVPPAARDREPYRAMVTPRVRHPGETAALSMEEVVGPIVRRGQGLVVIAAPPGSGRTTALRHLTAVGDVACFDVGREAEAREASQERVAVLATDAVKRDALATFELCPWGRDDLVEYLAKAHRERAKSVLDRLDADEWLPALAGSPQLLTVVMDRMAADESLASSYDVMRQLVETFFPLTELTREFVGETLGFARAEPVAPPSLRPEQRRWWRHEAVRRVAAAEWLAAELEAGRVPDGLVAMGGKRLLPEIARSLMVRPAAIKHLDAFVRRDPQSLQVSMAVSMLVRAKPDWRPVEGVWMNLAGASLAGVRWANVSLRGAILISADLSHADLRGADLSECAAPQGNFESADLTGAQLKKAKLSDASLTRANLTRAVADGATFVRAELSGADLTLASFAAAHLDEADLTGACARRAKFAGASMMRASVEGADFAGADLQRAHLLEVQMARAEWKDASFRGAKLQQCDLEGIVLPDVDLREADLTGSLLTGAQMPGARLRRAVLRQAGLADVDLTNADLRHADLSDASFHLGSTRSGLVGSTTPCEGSRTGFYTDDFADQDFMSPEEIRKACLCGADLRGAKIEQTDFYLVDVRGARYTRGQREVLERCGAILKSRV